MLSDLAKTSIAEVDRRPPARAHPKTSCIDAVTTMKDLNRGAILIEADDGRLVGVFSERDVLTRVDHEDPGWREQPVANFMTESPQTVRDTDTIDQALSKMSTGGFRHLPIVDGSGRAVSILSIRDLLAFVADHFPQEFLNLPPDPDREASSSWGG